MKTIALLFAICLTGCAGTSYVDPNYLGRRGNEEYRIQNGYLQVIDLDKPKPAEVRESAPPSTAPQAVARKTATAEPVPAAPQPVPVKQVSKRVQERLKQIQKILE